MKQRKGNRILEKKDRQRDNEKDEQIVKRKKKRKKTTTTTTTMNSNYLGRTRDPTRSHGGET